MTANVDLEVSSVDNFVEKIRQLGLSNTGQFN